MRVDSPFVAPMSKDYPVPPVPLKASGALMKIGASKLGLTVVRGPLAIISQHYQGRSACVNCGMCSGFGCHVKAPLEFGGHDAAARGEDRPLRNPRAVSYVREISVDSSGKVTGVVYFDAQKREVRQRAKAVILSANGTESARLLLLSKSQRFPDGLANSERRRRQVPDARQRRQRERPVRASAERLQGRRHRARPSWTSCRPIRSAASTAAAA